MATTIPASRPASSDVSIRCSDSPISVNNPEQDGQDSENSQTCLTCCEPIEIHSLGQCSHNNICHVCCLRRRELYKDVNCWCKTKLPEVVFTRDPNKTFADFDKSQMETTSKLPDIHFENIRDKKMALELWRLSCSACCRTGFLNIKQLKRHFWEGHRLFFCPVCLEHRPAFVHEQLLFTYAQLHVHLQGREGDTSGASVHHQRCEFCDRSFYNKDHLYKHLTDKHETCHICQQDGIMFQYFSDYTDLEKHFGETHFLCPEQECLEKKFVVFRSALDLLSHDLAAHVLHRRMSKEKKREAARLSLDLIFHNDDEQLPFPRASGRRGPAQSYSDEERTATSSSPLEEEKSWPTLLGDGGRPTPTPAPVLLCSGWGRRNVASPAKSGGASSEEKWPSLPAAPEKTNRRPAGGSRPGGWGTNAAAPPTPVNSNKQKKSKQRVLFRAG